MLYRDIAKILGYFFFGFAGSLLLPFGVAIYYRFFADVGVHPQPHTVMSFFASALITCGLGALFYWLGRKTEGTLYRREGIFLVVMIWLLAPVIATLPFLLSGALTNPFQAYFEMTSGFTTTGSSILQAKKYDSAGKEIPVQYTVPGIHDTTYVYYGNIDPVRNAATGEVIYEGIEAMSKALLFWRSLTQWIGGGGIVVLFVAILPALGVGGKQLLFTEVSGPVKDSLTPRIKETASYTWKIYLGISLLQLVMLLATNSALPLFDAVTIVFATVATGGFSVRNASIAAYHNNMTEWVVMLFMIIGSINFSLYFYALRGRFYRLYDKELFIFLFTLIASCCLVAYFIEGTEQRFLTGEKADTLGFEESIRYGAFQVVSFHTTTGFATADFDIWPYNAQAIMLIVMFLGGMAGSTAGGLKTMRQYMLFRLTQHKVESIFRPENVRSFGSGGSDLDSGTAIKVLCFFVIFISSSVVGTLLLIIDSVDPETSIGLVAATMNNAGMHFRVAGPSQSCAFLSDFGLCVTSFLMLLGRLEFYAVLAVLVPAFWKEHS